MDNKYHNKDIQTNLSLRDLDKITNVLEQTLYQNDAEDEEEQAEFHYTENLWRSLKDLFNEKYKERYLK